MRKVGGSREKGRGPLPQLRGVIGRHILRRLTFGSNPGSLYKKHKKVLCPSFFYDLFDDFLAVYLNFPSFFAGARAWAAACEKGWKMFFLSARVFQAVFSYTWPLARPNIREKGAAIVEKASGRVWNDFGRDLHSR